MEFDILNVVEFNVTMPSSLRFVEYFSSFIGYEKLVLNFASFLLELSIVEYRMLKHKASMIAASVLYVASKLLHKENYSTNENIEFCIERLCDFSGFSEEEIKDCAKDVCLIFDGLEKSSQQAIKKKYSTEKYQEVAKIKFGK